MLKCWDWPSQSQQYSLFRTFASRKFSLDSADCLSSFPQNCKTFTKSFITQRLRKTVSTVRLYKTERINKGWDKSEVLRLVYSVCSFLSLQDTGTKCVDVTVQYVLIQNTERELYNRVFSPLWLGKKTAVMHQDDVWPTFSRISSALLHRGSASLYFPRLP